MAATTSHRRSLTVLRTVEGIPSDTVPSAKAEEIRAAHPSDALLLNDDLGFQLPWLLFSIDGPVHSGAI